MEVYERNVNGKRIWYARFAWFVDGVQQPLQRKSTRIRVIGDEGSQEWKDSKTDAECVGRGFESAIARGGKPPTLPRTTVAEAIKKLISVQKIANKSDATLEIIGQKADNLFDLDDGFGADTVLHTIDADRIIEYAATACAARSQASVYRELLVLKQAYDAAGLVAPKFPDLGDMPASRDRVLEVEEQQKFITAIAPKRRLHVRGLLQLGPRKSELFSIPKIDWKEQYAWVDGSKTHEKAKRWVPIPDELFEDLQPYRDCWTGFSPWVNIDRDLRLAAEKAGIEPVSCNDLRRTYATHMARSGASPLLLAQYMGTSVRMLSEVYARLEKRGPHDHEAVARGVPRLKAPTE